MVQQGNSLESVAKRENWIEFGGALSEAMDNPSAYGLRTSNEVLKNIADLTGRRPHSLKNPLYVSRWLKEKHPEVYEAKPAWLGMTLVMYLMKIEELDAAEAKKITPKVFEGQMKQIELKAIFDDLRERKSDPSMTAGSIELSAPQRAQRFNDFVDDYLKRFGADFFEADNVTIQPGRVIDPISPDLVVNLSSGERVAVEVKSYRNRVDRHQFITTLGYLALIQKLVPEILMIVPEGSAYDLRRMNDLRDKLSLKGIRFATLPEKRAERATDLRVTE